MERLLRPYGLVIDGKLELGLELLLFDGLIQEVRPHTGIPESYVVSPAFVNAHSHLEYRGLQGKMQAAEYWEWLREMKDVKLAQDPSSLPSEALLAARENRATGVAVIGEHSDRPVSGAAIKATGLKGAIFQEIITRFSPEIAADRVRLAEENAAAQSAEAGVPAYLIPHAFQTVDDERLKEFGRSGQPISMHVAESDLENQLTMSMEGGIAESFRRYGVDFEATGKRLIPLLSEMGLVREKAQFVHCCAVDESDIELLASARVSVAHCPRSNVRLQCPIAPVREMLDAGLLVGLGLDSAASGGPIDMFDEMRSALRVSLQRGKAVSAEEVWLMATSMGADSLRFAVPELGDWRIRSGSSVPLIKLNVADAWSTEDLIERGRPADVEWV